MRSGGGELIGRHSQALTEPAVRARTADSGRPSHVSWPFNYVTFSHNLSNCWSWLDGMICYTINCSKYLSYYIYWKLSCWIIYVVLSLRFYVVEYYRASGFVHITLQRSGHGWVIRRRDGSSLKNTCFEDHESVLRTRSDHCHSLKATLKRCFIRLSGGRERREDFISTNFFSTVKFFSKC